MATPVTVPEVAERWWVALMSTPTENRSGWACSAGADRAEGLREHHGRAAVEQAVGLGVALDRHRGDHPLRRDLLELDAHPVVQDAHALRASRRGTPRSSGSASRRSCRHSRCRRRRLASAGARSHRRPPPPAAARRTLAGLSRVLRAAGRELLDRHRPAHQRGLRVHLDADQRAPRRAADPRRRSRSTCPGKTFRTEEYSEYKAKRNKTPDEFSSQLPLIERLLDALYIPFLKKPGYEADDIIGTLVTQAVADDMDVLIVSGDRDSFQLVSDRTTVLYPMRGVSELARMTPEAVRGQVRRPAGALPRDRRAGGGDLRQPARRARCRAWASPPSGSTSTTASTTSSPTPTRSPARRARRCASTSAT